MSSTVVDFLVQRASEQSGQLVFSFLDGYGSREDVTFGQLLDRVRKLSARMRSVSAPGDRILISCPPGHDFISAFYACLLTRRIAVPVSVPSARQQTDVVSGIAHDSGAVAVITPRSVVERKLLDFTDLRIIDSAIAASDDLDHLPQTLPTPDDIAYLQYTSGSTGSPKGVVIRHRNIAANYSCAQHVFGQTAGSGVFWLPPTHDMGLFGGILLPLFYGTADKTAMTLMSPWTFLRDPLIWLRAISGEVSTTAGGPSLAYRLCTRRVSESDAAQLDLSHWDVAFVGAEPVNAQVLREFADKFAVSGFRPESFLPTYGLAEGTLYVAGDPPGSGVQTRTFSGAALEQGIVTEVTDGRELVALGKVRAGRAVVVDPETCRRAGRGRVGEIWLRGKSIASGYWNNPEQTQHTFGAEIAGEPGISYLRTGDLGFFSEDELFLCGRTKEVLIVHGRNLFPHDLERSIELAHPELRHFCCAAFSVEVDGEERLHVVLELDKRDRQPDMTGLESSVKATISREYAANLYRVIFVGKGKIPKTTSGKIRRSLLSQIYSTELETSSI